MKINYSDLRMNLKVNSCKNHRDHTGDSVPNSVIDADIENIMAFGEQEEWNPATNLTFEEYWEYVEAFNEWWLAQQTQAQ